MCRHQNFDDTFAVSLKLRAHGYFRPLDCEGSRKRIEDLLVDQGRRAGTRRGRNGSNAPDAWSAYSRPVSLTGHLSSRASPVKLWIAERFTETRILARETNRMLCQESECPFPPSKEADPGLVGTALDYLIRSTLLPGGLDDTAATRAAERLEARSASRGRASAVEREAVRRINALGPANRSLSDDEWTQLCRLCLMLARFDQYFRSNGQSLAVVDFLVIPLIQGNGMLDFSMNRSGIDPSAKDLAHLGRAAAEDHRFLKHRRPLVMNPQFNLSVDLGGAEADLLTAGTLWDWKATATRSVAKRMELWQLLGYVLADTENRYEIHSVGLSAPRWRTRIVWSLEEFLATLSGGKHIAVDQLRVEFAGVVRKFRRRTVERRLARREERVRNTRSSERAPETKQNPPDLDHPSAWPPP